MPHHERPDHRPRRTGADESGDDESVRAEGAVTRPAGSTSDDDRDAPKFGDSACELRAENQRLERLVRTFGHDLRGQLMVASGHLELARAEPDATDHLDAIARAHDRIEALVEDVSTLVDDGGIVGEREPLVLERLVENCWSTVETTGATVVVDADRTVRADASRLSQVFENLFRNAVEHGTPGSRTLTDGAETTALTVSVGLLPKESGVFVEDDGPGIPAERREDVFEAGVSTDGGGTGLGLAIVREVVDAHGWNIEVTEGSDGGARFEITGVELRPPDA